MPLPKEAERKLNQVGYSLGDFTLIGLFINPATGEMGTYSTHGMEPGAILAFLEKGVTAMVAQLRGGALIAEGDYDGKSQTGETEKAPAIFGGESDTSRTAAGGQYSIAGGNTLVH